MDDLSNVEQPPIQLAHAGEGVFRTVTGVQVPVPPEGCERQQLLEWVSVVVISNTNAEMPIKLRVLEAYSTRWNIPYEEIE